MFVATKMLLVAAPANDKTETAQLTMRAQLHLPPLDVARAGNDGATATFGFTNQPANQSLCLTQVTIFSQGLIMLMFAMANRYAVVI